CGKGRHLLGGDSPIGRACGFRGLLVAVPRGRGRVERRRITWLAAGSGPGRGGIGPPAGPGRRNIGPLALGLRPGRTGFGPYLALRPVSGCRCRLGTRTVPAPSVSLV